jgi:hypothetical protein
MWLILYVVSTVLCCLITVLAVKGKEKRIEFLRSNAVNAIIAFPISIAWDFGVISILEYILSGYLWLEVLFNIINMFLYSWGAVLFILYTASSDVCEEMAYYFIEN